MPAMKLEGDSDGDGDMSVAESEHSGTSSRCPDRDSSAEEADEPDSDDSSEMDDAECERRRSSCLDNIAYLERQFHMVREQLYRERLSQVDRQLLEVRGERCEHYLTPLQRLKDNMHTRIEVAGVLRQMRLENVSNKYDAEEQAALQNFKSEKCLAWDFIQDELVDKIRRLEEERHNVDLQWAEGSTGTGGGVSSGAHGGSGRSRARRKAVTISGPYIVYMLNDQEIMEDWAVIRKALKRTIT